MYMSLLYIFIVFIIVRGNSAYHPHLLFKKYIVIKNEVARKLLISESDPVNSRAKNAKANRNKLTYAGIVFYSLFILLIIFYIVMLLIPDIPCPESKYLFFLDNTLNQKLTFIFTLTLLFSASGFDFINTSKYAAEKTTAKKTIRILFYLFSILSAICTIGGICLAVSSIIEVL